MQRYLLDFVYLEGLDIEAVGLGWEDEEGNHSHVRTYNNKINIMGQNLIV